MKERYDIEKLAKATHDIWAHWMRHYLLKQFTFTNKDYERWARQSITEYEDLSEDKKKSDRGIARVYLGHLF